ncbi:Spy/CpxP family protein refolding chaperone [Geoalkalibacter sp.]|uniref:Spy/CpxP family protein refolding chaperone n=1 Tax=Geoalkalibacter sp. TaxID=3041440 RepID=UPI00272DE044|nr:Spy/CpxP family protein refolding chaperone [Geoalkalibacter sp.]
MKKSLFIAALLTIALTAGQVLQSVQAEAASPKDRPKSERGENRGEPGERHLERMAKELGLSDAQQEQIRAIIAEHRAKAEPLRQSMEQNREQLRQTIKAENFDETAVRNIAADQAPVKTELMVERARMKNQIHALLTPEQQALAEKKMQERKDGHGGRHGKKCW